MSDMDEWKIVDALNDIEPNYITEYESLSSFVATKRMVRRQRMRIAGRIAACVAIVGTGVFLTVRDVNSGLIGKTNTESRFAFSDNEASQVVNGKVDGESHSFAGGTNRPGASTNGSETLETDVIVFCESIQSDAPSSQIVIVSAGVNANLLTLRYSINQQGKAKWYSGPGVAITNLDLDPQDKQFNNYGEATDYLLGCNEDGICVCTYEWGDSIGSLPSGHYLITTYLSDGNIKYEVNTKITVSGVQTDK